MSSKPGQNRMAAELRFDRVNLQAPKICRERCLEILYKSNLPGRDNTEQHKFENDSRNRFCQML